MSPAPALVLKPKLATWMFERNMSAAATSRALKCSKQTVLNITQPFGSPTRTVPHLDLLERIVAWTNGDVTAADFYPPHLNGKGATDTNAVREEART